MQKVTRYLLPIESRICSACQTSPPSVDFGRDPSSVSRLISSLLNVEQTVPQGNKILTLNTRNCECRDNNKHHTTAASLRLVHHSKRNPFLHLIHSSMWLYEILFQMKRCMHGRLYVEEEAQRGNHRTSFVSICEQRLLFGDKIYQKLHLNRPLLQLLKCS